MNRSPAAVAVWPFRLLAAATAVYTAILLFATHYPNPDELVGGLVGDLAGRDKTLHFTAYGLLGMLAASTLVAAGRWTRPTLLTAILLLAAFAAGDEITQPFFGRATEALDWVWDTVGIISGFAIVGVARAAAGRRPG